LLLASGTFRSIGLTTYNTLAFADVEPVGVARYPLFSAMQELAPDSASPSARCWFGSADPVAADSGWRGAAGSSGSPSPCRGPPPVHWSEALLLPRTAGNAVTAGVTWRTCGWRLTFRGFGRRG